MSAFDTETEAIEFENLARLAENLVYRLPGCADVMIRKTLQDVYRDFCRRSCCLRGRRQFTLDAGQARFAVPSVFGGVVDAVARVMYGRRELKAPSDYAVVAGATPLVMLAPRWVPATDCATDSLPVIVVDTVEIPSITSEKVPSGIIERHGEALCSGVCSRLMAMTGRAWTDAQQAADERLRYENAVCEERVRYYAQDMAGDGALGFLPATNELI